MFHPKIAALVAFVISAILVIGKGIAWFLSGSSTMLASLSDSIQDCFLSATNFVALQYAMKEADEDHRYGHGKMEGIAALGQAAFILGSCIYIFLDALRRFSQGSSVEYPLFTIGIIIGAIILNAGLVIYQNNVVRLSQSLAIEADRAHYVGDIGIHLGVIAAIVMDYYLGIEWADPVIAILIALWLARLAWNIGSKAINMLMDKELPDSERDEIKKTIKRTQGVLSHHDLRTHRHGQMTMMSFDIEVDPSISFIAAHNIAKRVEDRLHKLYPKSEIMIHVDPCGDITDSRHKRIKKHHVK
jgi:ferrous-iron efflux pump FieF